MNATETTALFGEPISTYTRAQALADGQLIDCSEADGWKGRFKYPTAITRAAFAATIEAGARWVTDPSDGMETLVFPAGQSGEGRWHDIAEMLIATMRNPRLDRAQLRNTSRDRVYFTMLVDEHGNGHPKPIQLYSVCGPGDNGEPVLTIMLRNED